MGNKKGFKANLITLKSPQKSRLRAQPVPQHTRRLARRRLCGLGRPFVHGPLDYAINLCGFADGPRTADVLGLYCITDFNRQKTQTQSRRAGIRRRSPSVSRKKTFLKARARRRSDCAWLEKKWMPH